MMRPSPNHGTQRLPNDDDDVVNEMRYMALAWMVVATSNTIIWTKPIGQYIWPNTNARIDRAWHSDGCR